MVDILAAVIRQNGGEFVLERATLDEPRPDEVLVRLVGTGVCHTDMFFNQYGRVPQVLGHEGAGIVERVGDRVEDFAQGDRVLMSYSSCGVCEPCVDGRPWHCEKFGLLNAAGIRADGSTSIHDENGEAVSGNFFGQSSFATYALATERNLVKVPDYVSDELFAIMGPLGCGIQTGAGAVMNTISPRNGTSIVIAGGGSVGLAAVLGAAAIGLSPIIVVDINESRLEFARQLGATHTIVGSDADVGGQITAITGGFADNGIDTTANTHVIRTLVESVVVGGTIALIGVGRPGAELTLDYASLQAGRILRGVVEGDAVPQDFIPRLIELNRDGRFPFEKLVSTYAFADIQKAVNDSEEGVTLKPVLLFDSAHS